MCLKQMCQMCVFSFAMLSIMPLCAWGGMQEAQVTKLSTIKNTQLKNAQQSQCLKILAKNAPAPHAAKTQQGISRADLRSLVSVIDSGFSVKLSHQSSKALTAILVASGNSAPVFAQNYLQGPVRIKDFAHKISKALVAGNAAAGLQKNLNLNSAQKVVVGLLTALLLIQSEGVPNCSIGPTQIGSQNLKGCLYSSNDLDILSTYFINNSIQGMDVRLYAKARRLMFAMLSGAGLFEYQNSKTHNLSVDSTYAKLWMGFLEKVNTQGDSPKPVVAFIEAFDSVNTYNARALRSKNLGTILDPSRTQNKGQAMDSFFSACAPKVRI